MKMSTTEKDYLNKIAVLSGKDISTVRDVLKGILRSITIELVSEHYQIIIPYICEMDIEFYEKESKKGFTYTKINLNAEPCEALKQEIISVSEGDLTPSGDHLKNNISKLFQDLLAIN